MPSTLVHAILPAACVVSRKASLEGLTRKQCLGLLLVCSIVANLPDLDIIGVILFPEYASFYHRNVGHNIFSLIVLVIVGKVLLQRVSELFSVFRAYLYSVSLVLSHLILDSGCVHRPGVPAGVRLLWPLSDWELTSPFPLFIDYQLNLSHHWFLGHVLSSDYWTRAFFQEVWVSCLIFVVFRVLDRLSERIIRGREPAFRS